MHIEQVVADPAPLWTSGAAKRLRAVATACARSAIDYRRPGLVHQSRCSRYILEGYDGVANVGNRSQLFYRLETGDYTSRDCRQQWCLERCRRERSIHDCSAYYQTRVLALSLARWSRYMVGVSVRIVSSRASARITALTSGMKAQEQSASDCRRAPRRFMQQMLADDVLGRRRTMLMIGAGDTQKISTS